MPFPGLSRYNPLSYLDNSLNVYAVMDAAPANYFDDGRCAAVVSQHVKGGTRVTEGETIHAGRSMKENMGAKEVRSAVHIGRSTVKGSLQVFDEEKFELQLDFREESSDEPSEDWYPRVVITRDDGLFEGSVLWEPEPGPSTRPPNKVPHSEMRYGARPEAMVGQAPYFNGTQTCYMVHKLEDVAVVWKTRDVQGQSEEGAFTLADISLQDKRYPAHQRHRKRPSHYLTGYAVEGFCGGDDRRIRFGRSGHGPSQPSSSISHNDSSPYFSTSISQGGDPPNSPRSRCPS
ncbi:hypothetical protein BGW80DRAFT_1517415 [Lactifluus volemus]|nr:hypothetical protein BGW80DRAFT_1517415 [Lactifluus volemus]